MCARSTSQNIWKLTKFQSICEKSMLKIPHNIKVFTMLGKCGKKRDVENSFFIS